jgi:hypothetical protein
LGKTKPGVGMHSTFTNRAKRGCSPLLSSKDPEDEGEDDTDDNTCGEWKIKSKTVSFHVDITGQTAYIRDFMGEKQDDSYDHDYEAQNDEYSTERGHEDLGIFPAR